MHTNLLEDETQYLQYGDEVETNFYDYRTELPAPSSWTSFPTLYKFTSVEINLSPDFKIINR